MQLPLVFTKKDRAFTEPAFHNFHAVCIISTLWQCGQSVYDTGKVSGVYIPTGEEAGEKWSVLLSA